MLFHGNTVRLMDTGSHLFPGFCRDCGPHISALGCWIWVLKNYKNQMIYLPHALDVMIMAAIDALNENGGSSKAAISKQMESAYPDLPAAHATLLAHHLGKMKQSGQLAMDKNNYLKPDPNAPPKRGRGRPPKPKAPEPVGVVVSPPRPRGRPPKPRDPFAPPAPSKKKSSGGSGRPRGRPPKKAKTAPPAAASSAPAAATGPPRGRGRPPKIGFYEISKLCAELSINGKEKRLWSVQDKVTKAAEKKLDLCLVGKILSPKQVNRDAFRAIIPRIWQTMVDIEIVQDNTYLFYFQNQGERFRVLSGGPWSFDNCLLVLEKLSGVREITRLPFNRVAFWVQIINAPLLCITKEMGEFIGRCLGDLVDIDVGVTGECFGKYMRLRVAIDISKPLKRFLRLELKK
ncbi:hypothetical protein EZV62_018481 [Acer yangbiense]|uniref:H15 domain-containing protein n=1 Tax=Acer yangbiense TaxID=1000413 RepID=A0A5C7HJW9_9ROSI|nr:hypothetical protein EZV62_018481 [Acer yangbiense]